MAKKPTVKPGRAVPDSGIYEKLYNPSASNDGRRRISSSYAETGRDLETTG